MIRKELPLFTAVVLFSLALLITGCSKGNEQPASPGAVKGSITNEYSRLLPGTVVTIQGNGTNTSVTAADGHYFFSSLAPGSYSLSVKKEGYIEASASLSITPGDTATKDVSLKAGTAYLNLLSDSVITARPYANTTTVRIASNTTWNINTSTGWILPENLGSGGDDSVVIRIATSALDTVRQGTFTIQAGSIVKTIVVKQLPDIKLKEVIPMPGNAVLGIKDSIALVFNQPVSIKSLFPGNTYCQSDIRFSSAGNIVTFSYACAALGGEYPFTLTTNNSLGDQYSFTFTAAFYEKNINLTGTIQRYFVNDADNSYWVQTDHPNALYKIDMTTFQILHQYDLPNEPVLFTVSPYNNKIYLAYRWIPKLYILNQDGTTDQVIDITRDSTRSQYDYNGPKIYPVQLAFTKNGKGMIWLSDNSFYSTTFWYIDAAANHRIWYQALPGEAATYADARTNWDKTKLVLTYTNSISTIGIFDSEQMSFSSYRPVKQDIKGFVTPSRKNGYVYVGQLYFQSIADPATGYESGAINHDNRNGGNADFCYKPGRDQTVYFTESGSMELIDYSTQKSPVKYDAIFLLKGTTATLDGRFVIAHWSNGNYNARVIQLPAAWFNY